MMAVQKMELQLRLGEFEFQAPCTCYMRFTLQQPLLRRSGGGSGSDQMMLNSGAKLHACEIVMNKPKKRNYNFLQAWLNRFPSRAKKIDVISRVVFPAIFAIFNLSYWCYYLLQEALSEA